MTIGNFTYPCTAGTGRPVGFHNFVATQGGVVCSLCGSLPFQTPDSDLAEHLDRTSKCVLS